MKGDCFVPRTIPVFDFYSENGLKKKGFPWERVFPLVSLGCFLWKCHQSSPFEISMTVGLQKGIYLEGFHERKFLNNNMKLVCMWSRAVPFFFSCAEKILFVHEISVKLYRWSVFERRVMSRAFMLFTFCFVFMMEALMGFVMRDELSLI